MTLASEEERRNITAHEFYDEGLKDIVQFKYSVCQYGDKIKSCEKEFSKERRDKISKSLLLKCKHTISKDYEIKTHLYEKIECNSMTKCISKQQDLCDPYDYTSLYFIFMVLPIALIILIPLILIYRKKKSRRNISSIMAMEDL